MVRKSKVGAVAQSELAEGIETLPLAVAVTNLEGQLRYINTAFEDRSRLSRDVVLGKALPELVGVHGGGYESCMRSIRAGQAWSGRWVAVLASGKAWIQDVQASPLRSEAQLIDGCMLVIRDLTEDDSLAERLQSTASVSALNSLAAGVAHEINNPLSFITGNVAYLLEQFDSLEDNLGDVVSEWRSALDDLQSGALRVGDIVHELGHLAHDSGAGLGRVDLSTLLDSTLALVQNQVRHRARLVREYTEMDPAWANASLLSQAILNLLINAVEAMQPGKADLNELRVVLRPGAAERVTIEIRDTGAGIPADVLPHIYDPFFSTKPVGDGTGMGLTVARRLITDMGGHITVRSQPGQGTCFLINLLTKGQPQHERPSLADSPPRLQTRRARILVVDDEVAVLRMIQRILGDHDVQLCDEGSLALELLETEEFDLIFCDLMMPEITGQELYARVQAEHPDIAKRFVFITGGAFTPEAMTFAREVENTVIEKPFTPTQLRELVSRMVGS